MAAWAELERTIMEGGEISRAEALRLLLLESEEEIEKLLAIAGKMTTQLHGAHAGLCAIMNAKSGLCGEDCAFCAQSVRFDTSVPQYPLVKEEDALARARLAYQRGAHEFCLVTSGAQLNRAEFLSILQTIRRIKSEVPLRLDVSIGFLTLDQAKALKEAGVSRVNHNVQTSQQFYSSIVRTHDYNKRIETLEALRQAGLELCCGVIIGVGESVEDRADAAFEIKPFQPDCVPINLLDPRPGTPLEKNEKLSADEILKTIAVYRLILPAAHLRLAGGRHYQLGALQAKALKAGINGLIIGEYLTTANGSIEDDRAMLEEAGFDY